MKVRQSVRGSFLLQESNMQRHHQRMLQRIDIRRRMKAGEPVERLVKVYKFMQPRRLNLRVQ